MYKKSAVIAHTWSTQKTIYALVDKETGPKMGSTPNVIHALRAKMAAMHWHWGRPMFKQIQLATVGSHCSHYGVMVSMRCMGVSETGVC